MLILSRGTPHSVKYLTSEEIASASLKLQADKPVHEAARKRSWGSQRQVEDVKGIHGL